MGWERRQRGGLYYVQRERRGDKVVSRYLGAGEVAALIAQMETGRRAEQDAEREQERQARAEIARQDQENAAYFAQVEALFRQAMEAAGYYRHNRGEWRKRGGKRSNSHPTSEERETAGHQPADP